MTACCRSLDFAPWGALLYMKKDGGAHGTFQDLLGVEKHNFGTVRAFVVRSID